MNEHAFEAERETAAREKDEVQSKLDALQVDFNNLNGRFKQSELNHQVDANTINTLQASLAEEKNKLEKAEDQAARDRNMIAGLEAKLDEEKKKLEKATLRHQEVDDQYSLLASLNLTKTPAISARPFEEVKAIFTRVAAFNQSTSHAAATILDSTNTDLPELTQLIADVSPNVFVLIVSGKVETFDKADIQRVEYDYWMRIRLIMDGKSLLICGTPMDVKKSGICESWMARSGVDFTIVEKV